MTLYRRQGSKTSPRKRNAKRQNEEALQIAEKRKETNDKGETERYTYWNAEFQRISRREKKNFLSNQCNEIEENSRMGKTRELLKYRDTRAFHPNMDII